MSEFDVDEEIHPFSKRMDAMLNLNNFMMKRGFTRGHLPFYNIGNEEARFKFWMIDWLKEILAEDGHEEFSESDFIPYGSARFVNQFATQHFAPNKLFTAIKNRKIVFWTWKTLCEYIGDDPLNYFFYRGVPFTEKRAGEFIRLNDTRFYYYLFKMLELLQWKIKVERIHT